MNAKQWIVAAAAVLAAGSAFSQQRTWVVPDAGFKSSMTRAEVRNELRHGDRAAWHQRDGQDPVYLAGTRNRKEIRDETFMAAMNGDSARMRRIYYGD